MNNIISDINSSTCEIIVNKLSTYNDDDNKMLMFNDDETIFKIKIKDCPLIVKIGLKDEEYSDNPYLAKKLKVIECLNKIFTFYEYMPCRLIKTLRIKHDQEHLDELERQLRECMQAYKEAFNRDGYFTLNSLLHDDNSIKLYSFKNNPKIQTLKDIIDETFIELFSKLVNPDIIIDECCIDENIINNYYKKIMSDMIDKNENSWNNKVKTKVAVYAIYNWIRENDRVADVVKILNEKDDFPFYYPLFKY